MSRLHEFRRLYRIYRQTLPPLQAQHSRDFAARKVCQGQAFEWADDKTLVCFKERP